MISRRIFVEDDLNTENYSFQEAVSLFNSRDYYRCHDVLEALWNESQEPSRTLLHGILQCAVGFHHLFNQNHKGAITQLELDACGDDICVTMDQSERSYQLLGGFGAGQ
ncbi:hypothetical protein K7X08_037186 [Anisodus acutangulus]|uniref:DUF309 domain-containing protein n=1 Tax=Anisodus acutangulus TaxID=402998 RepID=A0A9Q1MYA5_9SOLA|nr:hypothetical protein K7X08_037186 [Anisodus acutangulus]